MKFSARYWLFLLCCCLAGIPRTGEAQQTSGKFFIYIQDQGGSPFYLREGDTLLSSSPSGYMIIPQLKKGSYRFTIGFPRNEAPEASFDVTLDGNGDKGFLLRKGDDGLLNLYALKDFKPLAPTAVASAPGNRIVDVPVQETVAPKPSRKASRAAARTKAPETEAVAVTSAPAQGSPAPDDSDAFSRMLNEITGTSSSKQVPATPAQKTKPASQPEEETSAAAVPAGNTAPENPEKAPVPQPQTVAAATENPKPASAAQPEFITFQSDSATPAPAVPSQTQETSSADNPGLPAFDSDSAAAARREERKLRRQQRRAEKKAEEDSSLQDAGPVNAVSTPEPSTPEPATAAVEPEPVSGEQTPDTASADRQILKVNSDCQKIEKQEDFQKVRRKMASRSDDEGMFRIAEKALTGGSCFMTDQIQSLTYLFMTDEYKYRFLEQAYPHIADPRNFPKLVKTLGTDYYRKRFQAMIR
jgi:hypothetical protein